MAGRPLTPSGYRKPANRPGSRGGHLVHVLHEGEIWNDPQRQRAREAREAAKVLDSHDAAREVLVDEFAVAVAALIESGILRNRVREMFGLSGHQLSDLTERANTVRAIRELKGDT